MSRLYDLLGGNTNPPQSSPIGNPQDILQAYNQFRANFAGGQPQAMQMVQYLINSGRVSPEKYNWAISTIQQLQQATGYIPR